MECFVLLLLKILVTLKKEIGGGLIEKESNLSHQGNAWVYENAKVYENAYICENAQIYEDAWIYGWAQVYGNACIYGEAWVCGNARLCGDVRIYGNVCVYGNVQLYGRCEIKSKQDILISSNTQFAITITPQLIFIGCLAFNRFVKNKFSKQDAINRGLDPKLYEITKQQIKLYEKIVKRRKYGK